MGGIVILTSCEDHIIRVHENLVQHPSNNASIGGLQLLFLHYINRHTRIDVKQAKAIRCYKGGGNGVKYPFQCRKGLKVENNKQV